MEEISREDLNLVSMKVILHAGNAGEMIHDAIDKASEGDFEMANELLIKSNEEITLAHKSQTEMLQLEAEGIIIPYSPLFMHAQDTLMTTKSEIKIFKQLIKVYKKLGS